MRKTIFIVDDTATNLTMAATALEKHYRILTMLSAAKMFALMEKVTPDLILLDIEMPDMDGFETLKQLKAHESYSKIPVIFLTGLASGDHEVRGFEMGVVDFIAKPFSTPVLQNRIKFHLNIDELIRDRTTQLQKVKDGTISVLANIVETRDKNTGGHIERTSAYIKILLEAMAAHGIYAEEMRGWDIEAVVSSARLHDVGKIMISDLILNKPGKLTSDEFEMIKAHAIEGELIIDKIISQTNDEVFLHHAKLFAGYHHERWDGTGYSRQLKGLEIPLQGRIMAIVDTFDALVSERPYKFAFSVSEAIDIIMTGKGNHFDPLIADIFFKAQDSFKQFLSEEYAQ